MKHDGAWGEGKKRADVVTNCYLAGCVTYITTSAFILEMLRMLPEGDAEGTSTGDSMNIGNLLDAPELTTKRLVTLHGNHWPTKR